MTSASNPPPPSDDDAGLAAEARRRIAGSPVPADAATARSEALRVALDVVDPASAALLAAALANSAQVESAALRSLGSGRPTAAPPREPARRWPLGDTLTVVALLAGLAAPALNARSKLSHTPIADLGPAAATSALLALVSVVMFAALVARRDRLAPWAGEVLGRRLFVLLAVWWSFGVLMTTLRLTDTPWAEPAAAIALLGQLAAIVGAIVLARRSGTTETPPPASAPVAVSRADLPRKTRRALASLDAGREQRTREILDALPDDRARSALAAEGAALRAWADRGVLTPAEEAAATDEAAARWRRPRR